MKAFLKKHPISPFAAIAVFLAFTIMGSVAFAVFFAVFIGLAAFVAEVCIWLLIDKKPDFHWDPNGPSVNWLLYGRMDEQTRRYFKRKEKEKEEYRKKHFYNV